MLSECDLALDLKNDRYHTYGTFNSLPTILIINSDGAMDAKYQPVRYSMTYPATELHIAKARSAPTEIWMETKEMFERLHQPFISSQLHSLQWVYNILGKLNFPKIIQILCLFCPTYPIYDRFTYAKFVRFIRVLSDFILTLSDFRLYLPFLKIYLI
jgi:hypothetical protein